MTRSRWFEPFDGICDHSACELAEWLDHHDYQVGSKSVAVPRPLLAKRKTCLQRLVVFSLTSNVHNKSGNVLFVQRQPESVEKDRSAHSGDTALYRTAGPCFLVHAHEKIVREFLLKKRRPGEELGRSPCCFSMWSSQQPRPSRARLTQYPSLSLSVPSGDS